MDLSNIVQTVSGGDISQHPAARAVQELEDRLAAGDAAGMAAAAAAVAAVAAAERASGSGDKGGQALAVLHRAGAAGALARAAGACTDEPPALACVLRAAANLLGGSPRDLQAGFLKAGGIDTLQAALGTAADNASLAAAALQAAAASATKNEDGKAACMTAGLGSSCLEALRQHPDHSEALQAACAVLCALTTADDDTLPASRWVIVGADGAGLGFVDYPANNRAAICLMPATYSHRQGFPQCPSAGQGRRCSAACGGTAKPRPATAGGDSCAGQRPAAGECLVSSLLPRHAVKVGFFFVNVLSVQALHWLPALQPACPSFWLLLLTNAGGCQRGNLSRGCRGRRCAIGAEGSGSR